jgi:hypothetical protein
MVSLMLRIREYRVSRQVRFPEERLVVDELPTLLFTNHSAGNNVADDPA